MEISSNLILRLSISAPINEMLQCLSVKSPSPSTLPPGCYLDSLTQPIQDGVPESSSVSSPVDLQKVYGHNLQSDSYKHMWTQIQDYGSDYEELEVSVHGEDSVEITQEKVLSMVLQPNRDCVVETLENVKTSKLKRLISAYFDESENISNLFFLLRKGARQSRGLYTPLLKLLSVLPDDVESLTEQQCFRAYELFTQFDNHYRESQNPFLSLDFDRFKPMQDCFSKLKEHLNFRTTRSLSRANLIRRSTSGPGLFLIGTATVVAVAAAIATATGHLVLASVAAPCVAGFVAPKKYAQKEEVRAKKMKDAAYVTYGLDEHLKTINSLVDRLRNAIEDDKRLIQIGLDRNGDMYPIKQVVKHLRRNPSDFLQQLKHLEAEICLCFTAVNKARRLLQHICCAKTATSL